MRKLLLLFLIYVLPANANIVPNFTTGTMSSTTNTQTTITESITSKDYKTGYEYTVTGVGIRADGDISPDAVDVTGTVGGQSYTWKGADMTTKPDWTLTNPTSGDAFQFVESYSGPGLQNVTTINRTIETESVVTSTSVFQ
mgnify:FL=1|tara:strand:- start:116 stop:538 length:423 start_codon:yes stop_codon:yes gene_type:complete